MLKVYSRKKNVCKIFYAVKHNIWSVSTSVLCCCFVSIRKFRTETKISECVGQLS